MRKETHELFERASAVPAGTRRHLANLEAIDALALELEDDGVLDHIAEHLNETVFDRQEERH